MKITLVRNAETEEDFLKRIQGRKNILLNDTGRRESKRLRDKIRDKNYDYCFMSPLVRCVETAMILIGDRVEMIPENRISDRDTGEYEGKDSSSYNSKKYWDYDLNASDCGVESIKDLCLRCEDFFNYLLKNYSDKDILIVTHAANFRILRHLLLKHKLSGNLLDGEISNCQFEEYEYK